MKPTLFFYVLNSHLQWFRICLLYRFNFLLQKEDSQPSLIKLVLIKISYLPLTLRLQVKMYRYLGLSFFLIMNFSYILISFLIFCRGDSNSQSRIEYLNLGIIAPRLQSGVAFNEGIQDLAAIIMAVKEINQNTTLLANVVIRIAVRSDSEDFLDTIKTCEEFATSTFGGAGVYAVVGPYYDESTGYVALYFGDAKINTPVVAYKSVSAALGISLYPFERTSISEAVQSLAVAKLLERYGWNNVILFFSADDYGNYLSNEFYGYYSGNVINKFSLWSSLSDYSFIFDAVKKSAVLTNVFVIFMNSADAGLLIEQGFDDGLFHVGTQIVGSSKLASSLTWLSMKNQANVPRNMKGVLAVVPTVNRNNTLYDAFVKRWRAQPSSTVRYNSDGSATCNNTVDDTGAYIYKDRPGPKENYVCTGLDFSSFSPTGLDIADSALQAYDATYALIYGFNTVYQKEKSMANTTGTMVNDVLIYNVSFAGVTGTVDFNHVGIGADKYGLGDRGSGATFKFVNFDPDYYDKFSTNVVENGMRTIILWAQDKGYIPCDPLRNGNCASKVIFNTYNGLPTSGSLLTNVTAKSSATGMRSISISLTLLLSFVISLVLFL